MAKRFRAGIIGVGMIANAAHIPAYKKLADDVEIVSVADILPERAEAVARASDVPHAYADWRRMLEEQELDLVTVCTPNAYHAEQTIAALKSGAHVLCEKPVAVSHAQATAMFRAAEEAGRALIIGQCLRFYGDSQAARQIAEAGRLGDVYYAETSCMRRRGIPKWGQFHMKEHSGGGPVYDLGVHALDLLFWMMGNPKVVSVSGAAWTKFGNRDEGLAETLADSGAPLGVLTPRPYDWREFDVEDMAAGLLRLEGGGIVLFRTSWAANVPEPLWNSMVLGTEGGMTLPPLQVVTNMDHYQVNVEPQVASEPKAQFIGHHKQAEHVIRVLRGEEEPLVKKEEVLNVIRALDALYESAEQGREVTIEQGEGPT
jgi:predicted dehydrogenase